VPEGSQQVSGPVGFPAVKPARSLADGCLMRARVVAGLVCLAAVIGLSACDSDPFTQEVHIPKGHHACPYDHTQDCGPATGNPAIDNDDANGDDVPDQYQRRDSDGDGVYDKYDVDPYDANKF
jgi:hypothetical protein